MTERRTPARSSRSQRSPASRDALASLLNEFDIRPPGEVEFKLVSRWAAKHVWKVEVNGRPWAFIRYLLGSADSFVDRWRHLRLGVELYEAHVGPRILGESSSSEALGGRAVIVEAALEILPREQLEGRAEEAMGLFARLHGCAPLLESLSQDVTEADRLAFSPLANLFRETQERWFEAVAGRWLEVGLHQISDVTEIVSEIIQTVKSVDQGTGKIGIVVPTHNDPNHGNFMINRSGALRMIDFEGLALSNPVADLGIFLTWYVDPQHHFEVLTKYPLADPYAVLSRMKVWVPLKYLNIAAHWASRLTHATDRDSWEFAAHSIDEWLRGAAELIDGGEISESMSKRLAGALESLLAEPFPRQLPENPDSPSFDVGT